MPSGGLLGILDGLTGTDILVVLVVGLIVLGPEKLPEISRSMGQWIAKARRIATNLQAEMNDVLADPAMQPIKEIGEFVAQPRKKITEFALAAEVEANEEANAATQAPITKVMVNNIAEANAIVQAEPATEVAAEPEPAAEPAPAREAEVDPESPADAHQAS